MRRLFNIEKTIRFLLPVILMSLALWITFAPYKSGTVIGTIQSLFYKMDNMRYDAKISLLTKRERDKNQIVIVGIDSKSIIQEGPWPWRYNRIVQLITCLREQGASVIAFNSIFNQKEKNIVDVIEKRLTQEEIDYFFFHRKLEQLKAKFDENKQIVNQVKSKQDVVLPILLNHSSYTQGDLPKPFLMLNQQDIAQSSLLNMSGYLTNFNALQHASIHNGFISPQKGRDGIVRQQMLVSRHNNQVYLSLPLTVAQLLYPEKKIHLNTINVMGKQYLKSIQFGGQHILTGKNGHVWMPSYDKKFVFKYVSASDVLNHQFNPEMLKSAVVFIGSTVSELTWDDKKFSEVKSNIEIQATVLKAILEGDLLYTPYWNKAFTVVLILGVGTVIALISPLLNIATAILLAFILQFMILLMNVTFFLKFGIVLSLGVPLFMGLLLIIMSTVFGFLFEHRKKASLRKSFAQYVPPDYLKLLLENPDAYSFEGQSVELTVLFADIREFTTISEKLDASKVKQLLNTFFTPMTQIILKHGGTIDKYVGDMIMAFWGAPIENEAHAEAAIDASLDMLAKTQALKKSFRAKGLPEIELGIALNTGLMNVGDMGSKFRRSYTVIGDAVNLGSRLQNATAYYGVTLLVGSSTKTHQTRFVFRLIDKVRFKGKHEQVDIYEVVCRKQDATPALIQEIEAHKRALDAYFAKNWPLAACLFEVLTHEYPGTKLYDVFLKRTKHFEKHHPPSSWDGSYEFKDKLI